MVNKEKIEKVEEIREIFKNSSNIIFTDHSGLKAEDAVKFRDKLASVNSYLRIVKNTLMLLAVRKVYSEMDFSEVFKGPTSIIVVSGDNVVLTAKIIRDFYKKSEALRIKAGILENKLVGSENIEKLANIPGREVLLTNFVILLKSPITKLVNTLGGVTRSLVIVLDAIKREKEKNDN